MVKGGYATISHSDLNKVMFANNREFDQITSIDEQQTISLNVLDSVQDSVCFQLSEKAPILKKVFTKTVLKQGDKMSLKVSCLNDFFDLIFLI